MEPPMKLHDYQAEAVERVLAEPTRAALIADTVGLGKTVSAVEIALRAGWTRMLLIGIGDTFPQWKDTFERQSEGRVTIRRLESTKDGEAAYKDFLAGEHGFYFATIQWLEKRDFARPIQVDGLGRIIWQRDKKTGLLKLKERPEVKWKTKVFTDPASERVEVAARKGMIGPAAEPVPLRERKQLLTFKKMCDRKRGGLDAVVFDESHLVSNHSSIGRKVLTKFHGGEHNERMWKIALSATWSGNSFENAWSAPNWLWPERVPAYGLWREEWCETEDVYVPGRPKPVNKVVGEKRPGEWVKSLPCYIRREATEEPPAPVKIYVEPTEIQKRQMEDLRRDLMTWVDTRTAAGEVPLVVDVPGAMYARYKQLALAELTVSADGEQVSFPPTADSAKLRVLRGLLDQWGDQPVALLTDSKKFALLAEARMKAAGYRAGAYTGNLSKTKRKDLKQAFISGEVQYLIGTVQAMGTGLDGLQRVCSKVVWLNKPDGDVKLEDQALGRFFRQGRTLEHGEFQQVVLIQRGSADEKILEGLVAQASSMQASVGAHNLAA